MLYNFRTSDYVQQCKTYSTKAAKVHHNCYSFITVTQHVMRAHSSGRVTSFVTETEGVHWRKILHLTGYDVSHAVCTTLTLDNIHVKKPTNLCHK
jgi:hypothetical protein